MAQAGDKRSCGRGESDCAPLVQMGFGRGLVRVWSRREDSAATVWERGRRVCAWSCGRDGREEGVGMAGEGLLGEVAGVGVGQLGGRAGGLLRMWSGWPLRVGL